MTCKQQKKGEKNECEKEGYDFLRLQERQSYIIHFDEAHSNISHTVDARLRFHPSEQRNGTVYELTMKILFLTNRSVGVFRARFSCAEQRVKLNIHYSSKINSLLLTVRSEYFQFVFFSLSHGSLSWTFAFFFICPSFPPLLFFLPLSPRSSFGGGQIFSLTEG